MSIGREIQLLLIDPQMDFCDPNGALYVPGAEEDIRRLSRMIDRHFGDIDDIHVTLDSHHYVHIAHPVFWVDSDGNHPDPFTVISVDDVNNGKWRTYNPGFMKKGTEYVQALSDNGRYSLVIWPPHCLIGSKGHAVMPELFESLGKWESQFNVVDMVTKGSNLFTEHYSAVRADVIDPDDPFTMLNMRLVDALRNCGDDGKILIAGEALSHCVANTIRDVADEFSPDELKKFVILEDASSNVTGFEHLGTSFIEDMEKAGMEISTTEKFFSGGVL